eukprot:3384184-Prymnesium_polylepis.1
MPWGCGPPSVALSSGAFISEVPRRRRRPRPYVSSRCLVRLDTDGERVPAAYELVFTRTPAEFSLKRRSLIGRWPMLSPKAVSGDYACPA